MFQHFVAEVLLCQAGFSFDDLAGLFDFFEVIFFFLQTHTRPLAISKMEFQTHFKLLFPDVVFAQSKVTGPEREYLFEEFQQGLHHPHRSKWTVVIAFVGYTAAGRINFGIAFRGDDEVRIAFVVL